MSRRRILEDRSNRSLGITAISWFFIFGALMSALTVTMLLFPGSVLEPIWRLNPRAHQHFILVGSWAVLLMAVVCVACTIAGCGLWKRAHYGYSMAVAILILNLVGDSANALIFYDWRTLIGLPIGGIMLCYLVVKRHIFVH